MMMQHLMLGDPLTRLALDNKSDLYMMPQEVKVTSTLGNPTLSETDSTALVTFILRNAGVNESHDIPLKIIHRYDGGVDTIRQKYGEICSRLDLLTGVPIVNQPGTHTLTFIIDPDTTLNESRIANNSITINFEVFSAGLSSLDPRPYWDVDASKPAFRFVMPQPIAQPEFEFRIETSGGSAPVAELIASAPSDELTITNVFIEWMPRVQLQVGESYRLLARLKNTATGRISDWLNVPLYAVSTVEKNTARWRQKSAPELLGNTMNNVSAVQIGDSAEIHLYDFRLPIVAYSCGNGGGSRYGRTVVGEHEYTATVDQTSFSITHLPPNDTIGTYRNFYTFGSGNLNCNTVVRYLRDSIADGEIVIITAADACFDGFAFNPPDSIGHKSNLIRVLKEKYSSTLIDSVFYGTSYPSGREFDPYWRYLASWAIITRKGDSTFLPKEAFNSRFDTVTVRDTLKFYAFSGSMTTPVIGPAYAWDSLSVVSEVPPFASVRTEVYGKSKQSEPEQLLKVSDSTGIALTGISAKEYPYIRLKTRLERTRYSADPIISGIYCSYTPTVEYAVLPGSVQVSPDAVLRGDTSTYTA